MSINLKIVVPAQGVTKVMRFAEQMSVHEVCKGIMEKVGIGGKDHGLFQPIPLADSCGRWLKAEKTLEFYDIKSNDTVEYRKKHDAIKVKLVDDTVKTVLVDLSAPVSEVVDVIGKKIALRNADEFSLQAENKPNVWMKTQMSICEQVTTMDQMFLLKKKFFVNDANLDQDDPVQLHLVYCQSRDDVLSGRHPVVKDEAIQLAALQCQIQLGDYRPETHKNINLAEFFAPQWQKKEMQSLLFAQWKTLVGMNEVNARFRYVQLCRSLKTYGMTVYLVKERVPGKKKLMDGLLCFTRDSIIRMEAETMRVIKEHPFKHLMRWAASPETFTLDFGAYEEGYVVVVSNEGEAISNLIAGYIDLMLKKQRDTGVVIEDDNGDLGQVTNVGRVGGMATTSVSTSNMGAGGSPSYAQGVEDCMGAAKAIDKMCNDLFGEVSKVYDNNLTPEQRRNQIDTQAKNLGAMAETMEQLAKTADRTAMNAMAHKIAAATEQLINAARQAYAAGADPDKILFESTKGVSEALKNLLSAAQTAANKPNDVEAKEALLRAQQAAVASIQKLSAASKGTFADEAFQQLFKELAKAVSAEAQDILGTAQKLQALQNDPAKRQQLQTALSTLQATDENFAKICEILAPVAQDPLCKGTVGRAGKGVEQTAAYVMQTAKSLGADPKSLQEMGDAQKRLADALNNVLGAAEIPDMRGAKESDDFTDAAQAILQSTAALMAAEGNPEIIRNQTNALKATVARLGNAGKGIIAGSSDPAQRERLANYLKAVVEGTKKLVEAATAASTSPSDKNAQRKLRDAAQEVAEATQQLIGDTGRAVAVSALYNSAKLAAAATTKLCTSSRMANAKINDPSNKAALQESSRSAAEAVQKLIGTLKNASTASNNPQRRTTSFVRSRAPTTTSAADQAEIMQSAENFAPIAFKLVSTAKGASASLNDPERKQDPVFSSNNAAKAIHKMLSNRKALKAVKGQMETAEALEQFKAAQADLESALISCDTGILKGNPKLKDEAIAQLSQAIQELAQTSKQVATASKTAPEELGTVMKQAAIAAQKAVASATALASSLDDKLQQKAILNSMKAAINDMKNLMQVAKAVSASPEDPNLNNLLMDATKAVAEALKRLTEASKGVIPKKVEEFQEKASADMESLAEQELKGAANVIEKCVAKLNAAAEAARLRATEKGIDIDEQNITEAIMEAAQAIAKSTAILVNAATLVQQEFQKMVREPKTGSVYKRDPQWAQGLISAARTVAGAVQHLVKAANSASQGEASEEALIVAAQAVSAATAQLVTASTVKADPNSQAQQRLRDASSKVTQATSSLVNAAKNAAKWEEEKLNSEQDEKFSLSGNKIQEMEKQMEILRLEKQLESARQGLSR